MLRTVEAKCNSGASTDLECSGNMLAAPDNKKNTESIPNPSVKLDKIDLKPKATEDDPKPRIVLTFRSEKTGTRSANMKIVSAEEKQEEISPRRSNRIRVPTMWDSEEEEFSPRKEKATSSVSENDEASDGSTPKRSTRRRSKEFSDNVIANAIARKEKYNDPAPMKRPSRQIKPTPKVLGNKELRWLQSQPQSNVIDRSEEGVKTRRSARRKSFETAEEKKADKVYEDEEDIETEEMELEESQTEEVQSNNVKKLKHLCELGLRAINPESLNDSQDTGDGDEEMQELDEDEELDEELISKLAEGETGSEEDDDDEFYCAADASFGERPRRSTRLCSGYGEEDIEDGDKSQPRRSTRVPKCVEYLSDSESRNAAGGDDGSEATYPEEEAGVIATCYCEAGSNVYASPKDLEVQPVFCQAVELVDGVRVGCSHGALRTERGFAPLVRSGPRAPYLLACERHNRQLRIHMCCAACGCFCTQGVFYRCNQNHYFHLECGISADPKQRPGCPHCGVYSRGQPANRECHRVRITAQCSNKRVFLPDQREQCTPAYLGFSSLDPSSLEQESIIPPELLPSLSVDVDSLSSPDGDGDATILYHAILAGTKAEELLPLIVSCPDINKPVTSSGGTVVHAAARRGHLAALYLVQYAGANINAEDERSVTPLMCAVRALPKKTQCKPKPADSDLEMDVDPESDRDDDEKIEPASDGDLLRVIQYLVAAGCDVNSPGPEGMTALHTAARYGHSDACAAILGAARALVDPRDHGGWTPLVWAAEHSHADVVRLLLSHGADPTATDNEGNAAAHWCALAGDSLSLRLLVEASPRAVAAVNAHRDTPLHVAARQGHYPCVVILLAHGARTDVVNTAGELPAEVCTGECQSAVSLNTQMAASREQGARYKMLCSDISNGREQYPIPCVNEVDDAPVPADFTYVIRHVTPRHVAVDTTIDTLQGCTCSDGTCSSDTCSCQVLSVKRWFHKGRLLPDFPYHEPPMLFQCNHACSCNTKLCTNAVVTRATQNSSVMVKACVFRAGGAKGWGLRAMAKVARGSPVATYCGELLSLADADTRSADHYMFALDIKPDLLEQCEYKVHLCVDAARYGSAARFINHSCQPNLAPVRVFTCCRDLRLPAVCLFAIRDIAQGEEFAFDYGDKFWSVKSKWMKCECGSSECRYPVQSSDDTE